MTLPSGYRTTIAGDVVATVAEARPLADLLDDAQAFLTRYIVLGEQEAVATTLWIAHAWVLNAFDATGYLEIRSPVRRCGKTTLLDVLELLVPRSWKAIEPSEAVLYRKINASHPTLLLDEVDAIFSKRSEATEGLRACLNAGNKRGTTVPRCVPPSHEVTEFAVFCPKALAGIGGLPATITDRSIPIEMRRKEKNEHVERYRSRAARALAEPIAAGLARWAETAVADVERELLAVEGFADEGGRLSSLDDRAWEQAWEPLIAVSSLAGKRWLDAGIAAAVHLSGSRDDELDDGVTLLRDTRTIFDDHGEHEALATLELLDALLAREESPWRERWSDPRADDVRPSKAAARKLAQALKPFGIRPVDIWTLDGSRKGYRRDHFYDAWARYLPDDPREARGARESSSHATSGIAEHGPESARDPSDPRDPRDDPTDSSRSRAPRGHRGSSEDGDALDALGARADSNDRGDTEQTVAVSPEIVGRRVVLEHDRAPDGDLVDGWECPCGQEPPKPGSTLTPVATFNALREPACRFCGRAYKDEYRVSLLLKQVSTA
jgi:Protein of unknown function (DUF3631)